MAELEYLKIKNFQSHKDTELHFSPGINVICGASNVGKTAIVRSLIKLWKNRPLGTRQIANFAGNSSAHITGKFNDTVVSLEFGKDTLYTVERDGKLQEFKSFGSNVPDLVSAELNLDAINFQTQLEQHFLIVSTPGDVARDLNKITRIERVDAWVSALTTKVNNESRDIKLLDKQILEDEQKLYLYKDIEKFEEDVAHGEYLETQIEKYEQQIVRLQSLLKELVFISQELQQVLGIVRTLQPVLDELEVLYSTYCVLEKKELLLTQVVAYSVDIAKYNEVVKLSPIIHELETRIAQLIRFRRQEELLSGIIISNVEVNNKRVFVDAVTPQLTQLEMLLRDYSVVVADEVDINDYVVQLKKKEELLVEWRRSRTQSITALASCLKLLGRCPTCNTAIDQSKIDDIVKEL